MTSSNAVAPAALTTQSGTTGADGRWAATLVPAGTITARATDPLSGAPLESSGTLADGGTLALELAPHSIRVNSIHPGCVDTLMIQNSSMYSLLIPDVEEPTRDQAAEVFQSLNALPVPLAEPRDISNAVLFLASDEARYVTGVALPVDAGVIIN